jgi:hypothetical protein
MTRVPFACGKKNYQSWDHASNDAKVMRRKGYGAEAPYYCRRCQAWHVGSGEWVPKKRRGGARR